MLPAFATVNWPVNTASKAIRSPTSWGEQPEVAALQPACCPLPCATIVPVKLPFWSVVTSVKGRVSTPMLEGAFGTLPEGGLKLIVGKNCENTGVAVGRMSNVPFHQLELGKKRPHIVLVETFWRGATQLTVAVLEVVDP